MTTTTPVIKTYLCAWDGQPTQGKPAWVYKEKDWSFCAVHWAEHQGSIEGIYTRENLRRSLAVLWRLLG